MREAEATSHGISHGITLVYAVRNRGTDYRGIHGLRPGSIDNVRVQMIAIKPHVWFYWAILFSKRKTEAG
jgi:hypothetical protein